MLFYSIRLFQIWIYTVSHSILLLRSTNNEDEEENGYNIDIEFWGVAYLELPDMLNGLKIQKLDSNIPNKFNKYTKKIGCDIFEILSENNLYYVVAVGCRVGKNNWLSENRVINPNLDYEEILAVS